jgi:osmoprotectant transport system permease protein
MPAALAERLQIATISDLAAHPALRAGISYEFLKRQDGWDALADAYRLPQLPVGLEHGLAYQSLAQGHIDITDAYSTDGEIPQMGLRLLTDDRQFFPPYEAVALYRPAWHERIGPVLEKLKGAISEAEMQRMNAEVVIQKRTIQAVANDFLLRKGWAEGKTAPSVWRDLLAKTARHLALATAGLLLSMLVALPLGVWLYWHNRLASPVLYITGLLQTIPSIALLAMFIPWMGIGVAPAISALFLYGLLPLLRNTLTGLRSVDPLLKKVSLGMGLTRRQQLWWIEWPLALPTVLAGIRTAAVINVGTATLAAFIGAGGLGEYIVTGLALNNTGLILRGALPAALLAIVVELVFELIERRLTPPHLRVSKKS